MRVKSVSVASVHFLAFGGSFEHFVRMWSRATAVERGALAEWDAICDWVVLRRFPVVEVSWERGKVKVITDNDAEGHSQVMQYDVSEILSVAKKWQFEFELQVAAGILKMPEVILLVACIWQLNASQEPSQVFGRVALHRFLRPLILEDPAEDIPEWSCMEPLKEFEKHIVSGLLQEIDKKVVRDASIPEPIL